MYLNFYHIWRSDLCQGWGDLWMLPFLAKRIRCYVSSGKNCFVWHPRAVWKFRSI